MSTLQTLQVDSSTKKLESTCLVLLEQLVCKNAAVAAIVSRLPFAEIDQSIALVRRDYHLSEQAQKLLSSVPRAVLKKYLAAYLLHNIAMFDDRFNRSGIPSDFQHYFMENYERIINDIKSGHSPDDPASDGFAKELSLATLKIIPAVAQLISTSSGLGLRMLAKIGPIQSLKVISLVGGRKPFLEIHTHDATAGQYFNPEGWERTYSLAAKLLHSLPNCRGLIGSSWFYDPALAKLSPRLAYLRGSPTRGGAIFSRVGTDTDSVNLATLTSPTRREAFNSGTYRPCRYIMVWPRSKLLENYL